MKNIGYCCISIDINKNIKVKKNLIQINRGMIKKTFDTKGLNYVSELVILNLNDTLKVLEYNIKNNIYIYRMSSDSFPWLSNYNILELPNINNIKSLLKKIGDFIKNNNMRCGYHPGPFNVLPSENISVVNKTIDELNKHAEIMDLMGLEQSTYYYINIHVSTTKPSLEDAAKKFCDNFKLLSESCRKRLTVENDDSPNQYSVKMLYNMIHKVIGIPIVFDQHHFIYGPNDQTMEEALKLAHSTWRTRCLTHMSSSKKIEDNTSVKTAHADYIYEKIETFGMDFDIEIEAKAKDLAVFRYRKDFIIS